MKHLVVLGITCLFLSPLAAQEAPLRWGKVADEDLAATRYEWAPDADAVVLADYGQWLPLDFEAGTVRLVHHYQIKILTEAGLRYARGMIGFDRNEEALGQVQARLHYLDGTRARQEKLRLTLAPDSTLNPDSAARFFQFPDAAVGSVVEVRYTLVTERMDVLRPWYFQREIPVRHSELRLSGINFLPYRTKTYPADLPSTGSGRWKKRFIPALPAIPHLDDIDNYRLHLRFQLLPMDMILTEEQDWQDMSYALELGTLTPVEEPVLEALVSLSLSLTRFATTEQEKMAAIYRHVQRYLRWDGTFSTAVTHDPGTVYKSRKGNSAEINMLLFLLLESAGLRPSRVFVSTRDHGRPVDEPFWNQFNHLILRVVADGQPFFLDASQQYYDYPFLALPAVNGRGRMLTDSTSVWIDIPASEGSLIRHNLMLTMAEDGSISGEGKDLYVGYPAAEWNQDVEMPGFSLSPAMPGLEPAISPAEEPVEVNYPARKRGDLPTRGDTLLLPLDLYGWLDRFPTIAPDRALPADFGYPLTEVVNLSIQLPEGWSMADAAISSQLALPQDRMELELQVKQTGTLLQIGWIVRRNQARWELDRVNQYAAFEERLRQELSRSLHIVRN